ncbi:MAG: prmC [Caloramator sp.]|jgi:uncharacterized protein YqhQ|nr:prmC [Caloramator sp.]
MFDINIYKDFILKFIKINLEIWRYKMQVGGQAVIEGVMMRAQDKMAVAVRKPDGEIEVSVENIEPLYKKYKILSLPFIRGAAAMIESLIVGIKTLQYSASFYEDEEDKSRFEKYLDEKFKGKSENIIMSLTLFTSFAFAIFLFVLLPTFAANFFKSKIQSNIYINLFEGFLRLIIFLVYIYLISKMEDIRRVFEYHGAEHKSVFCFEAGIPLTVENVSKFSTLHPRCGTNFLLIVMLISIFIFSFFGWPNIIVRIVSRILLIPVVAGISYEIIKWLGKSNTGLSRALAYPGLMLQRLTTRDPDEKQIEVAIAALKAAIGEE